MKNWSELNDLVIKKQLCCFCGTCVGVCPGNAVSAKGESFLFDEKKCIFCGKCIDVCPGRGYDYVRHNSMFSAPEFSFEPEIGYFLHIYKGRSANPEILGNSSSGGIATAISLYLLDQQKIDGVVGIIPKDTPTDFIPAVLNTSEDIIRAAGSKYTLVPTNTVIAAIIKNPGGYLYIGLPCQVQGLRLAMERMPLLKERIVMVVSLFCGLNMSRGATEYLIKKSKIENIESFKYRTKNKGKTGALITGDNGKEFFIDKHGYTFLNAFYSPVRCWKCYDYSGEFAELSLGDAWEMENGSRIIVRSESAMQLMGEMQKQNLIYLEDSCVQDMLNTQKKIVLYKKRDIGLRTKKLKNFPDYNIELYAQTAAEKIKAGFFLNCMKLVSTNFFKSVLSFLPIKPMQKLSRGLRGKSDDKTDAPFEFIRYLFWGIFTVAFGYASYYLLLLTGLDYKTANLISIILTKTQCYITNKFFVFRSRQPDTKKLFIEIANFILTRGLSGIVDYFGLILMVDFLHAGRLYGKALMLIITTMLNYFFGKTVVFKK